MERYDITKSDQAEDTALPKKIKVDTKGYSRIIAISDIHGNLSALKQKLDEVNFSNSDILILMGDYIERGNECLALANFIFEFSVRTNVIVLAGNCDNLMRELYKPVYRKNIRTYLKENPFNIIREIQKKENIDFDCDIDLSLTKEVIKKKYSLLYEYFNDLPHIAETEKYIFVHAGLISEESGLNNINYCLKAKNFYLEDKCFNKTIVVGHMPVRFIREDNKDDILFDEKRNIYFIDGGMGVFIGARLNALIIDL